MELVTLTHNFCCGIAICRRGIVNLPWFSQIKHYSRQNLSIILIDVLVRGQNFILVGLGFELKAIHLPGRPSTP
jgi:hypothetical protein